MLCAAVVVVGEEIKVRPGTLALGEGAKLAFFSLFQSDVVVVVVVIWQGVLQR